jgi:hypothetical protein
MRGCVEHNGTFCADNLTADGGCNSRPCVNQEMPHPSGSARFINPESGTVKPTKHEPNGLQWHGQVAMDSAREGTGEASSRSTKPTWVIGLLKMGRIGTWQTSHDHGSLLRNPAHRLRPTATSNDGQERGNLTVVLWHRCQSRRSGRIPRETRWGKKPTLPCNAADMLTYPRLVGR